MRHRILLAAIVLAFVASPVLGQTKSQDTPAPSITPGRSVSPDRAAMSPVQVMEGMFQALRVKRWDDLPHFLCAVDADRSIADEFVPEGMERERFLGGLSLTITAVSVRLVSQTQDKAQVAGEWHISAALEEDVLREWVVVGLGARGETTDDATIDAKIAETRQKLADGFPLDGVYPFVRENGVWVQCPSAIGSFGSPAPSPAPTATPAPSLTASPGPVATLVPEPSASSGAMPGVEGDSFQSLFYALNFVWDDHWRLVAASTPGDRQDSLTLASDVSTLYLHTYPWEEGTEGCVDDTIGGYEADPAASEVSPALDPAGAEMRGSRTGFLDSYGAVTLAYGSAGVTADYGIYISCWTVHVGPDSVARFLLVSPIDAFQAEVAALDALLESIRI